MSRNHVKVVRISASFDIVGTAIIPLVTTTGTDILPEADGTISASATVPCSCCRRRSVARCHVVIVVRWCLEVYVVMRCGLDLIVAEEITDG
jgi:hypothetical protein